MDLRQSLLLEFVKIGHFTQKRKYTNEPYFTHTLRVGKEAQKQGISFGFEIGICHDLFEDTFIQEELLRLFMEKIGYVEGEIHDIITGIIHLTDEFVKEKYPHLNRRQRKILEVERLSKIPADIQTIKYIDCIDNGHSICANDKDFAMPYLKEIWMLLAVLDKGDPIIFKECQDLLMENLNKYSEENLHEW